MKYLSLISLMVLTISCNNGKSQAQTAEESPSEPVEVAMKDGLKRAYFASGCFWCVEEIYESVKGVEESISGYAGGHTKNPTYEESNTGRTGHAEAVEVYYDPDIVDFKTLVDVYFASQNIEQENGQGPDRGSQYRSIIFYQNDEQKQIIDDKIASLEAEGYDVAAEVMPFEKFWEGEDYHQDYAEKHPNHPYIQNVSIPRWRRFAERMPAVIKEGISH